MIRKKFLEDHPDFNYKQEVKNAKKVAKAMKAEGWEFASHTWDIRMWLPLLWMI